MVNLVVRGVDSFFGGVDSVVKGAAGVFKVVLTSVSGPTPCMQTVKLFLS